MSAIDRVLMRLEGVEEHNGFYRAFCPAHYDRHTPNLDVREGDDGRVLLICRAGCETEDVLSEIGLEMRDLFEHDLRETKLSPNISHAIATAQPCTLEAYAAAKGLPVGFLEELGLADRKHLKRSAIRIPYLDPSGKEVAVRFRVALEKGPGADNRFRWRAGSKALLYGLWRLEAAREAGYVVLVEGESDCHTLWYHGFPALGVPGASNWKPEWSKHLQGIERIYAVVEPDAGGGAFRESLSR